MRKMGGMAIMGAFGTAFFTACGSEDDPTPSTPTNPGTGTGITITGNIVTINTAQQSSLNSDGAWLLIPQAQLLVFNDGGIKALTSVCTHSGCDRNWSFSNRVFICSCHNSRFNTSGAVLQGPANSPLRSYPVTVNNGIIAVDKS